MASPLAKTEPDGTLYRRPAAVEAQVGEAIQLKLPDLRCRHLVTDRNDAAYLHSECLVHLLRHGRRAEHGAAIAADLRDGFTSLPDGMQNFLRPLLDEPESSSSQPRDNRSRRSIRPSALLSIPRLNKRGRTKQRSHK